MKANYLSTMTEAQYAALTKLLDTMPEKDLETIAHFTYDMYNTGFVRGVMKGAKAAIIGTTIGVVSAIAIDKFLESRDKKNKKN